MNTEANFQPQGEGQPQAVVKAPEKPKAAKKPKLFTRQNMPFLAIGGTLFVVSLIMLFSPNIEWLDGREVTKLDIDQYEREITQYKEDYAEAEKNKTDLHDEMEAKIKAIENEYAPKLQAEQDKMDEASKKADENRKLIDDAYSSLINGNTATMSEIAEEQTVF